jgi:hypothetical protein
VDGPLPTIPKSSASLGLEVVEPAPCAGDHAVEIGRQYHHVEAPLYGARGEFRAGVSWRRESGAA